jgi:hypothetical protein
MELEYYHNSKANSPSKEESLFMANVSSIQHKQSFNSQNFTNNNSLNFTGFQITPKEDKDSFQRYLDMGKKVNDNLKNNLTISEKRKAELEKEAVELK